MFENDKEITTLDNKNYNLALQEYLKIPNKTPEVIEAIAACYLELNDTVNAKKYYNELLSENSNNLTEKETLSEFIKQYKGTEND